MFVLYIARPLLQIRPVYENNAGLIKIVDVISLLSV